MNCLIVDDNLASKRMLVKFIDQIKDIGLCTECSSAIEAYNYVQLNEVDIIFLEIEMPGMNGIEFAKNLIGKRPAIIFTSSKDEYALEAFDLQVIDYLLKPIKLGRLIQTITKVNLLINRDKELKRKQQEFIFIKDSNIIRRLRINDILYAEAMGDYVKLVTEDRFHAIHTKFAIVEDRLPADKFLRVHRSYIVALNKIDTLHDRELMINGKCLPVAITYKNTLNERMNIL